MFSIQSFTENALFEGEPSRRGWNKFHKHKVMARCLPGAVGWKGNPTKQAAKETSFTLLSSKNGGEKL